jgi:N-acetyl-anhydromuramyl-L-alanine amidase AmpD
MVAPFYPGALWIPAHITNFRATGRTSFSRIVIHCTDGRPLALPVAQMWQEPNHKSSAHFVVGQDGTVIQAVRTLDVAFHAHHASDDSIGIEHCARTPGELSPSDPGLPPNSVQLQASARLCAWLLKGAGLPADRTTIVGHAEADPQTTHTKCPEGSGLLLDPFAILVAVELAAIAVSG